MRVSEKIGVKDRSAFRWLMLLLLLLAVLLSLNFPINIDELLHYNHSKLVVDWYQSGGEDKSVFDTPWSNLKYYGQSVDSLTVILNQWFKPADEFLVRHITGAVFAWLLIIFTSLIALEISGRYRMAIIAAVALILIPPVMGQYCNNLKDIPFAAGYSYAILFLIRLFKKLPHIPWTDIVHLSLAIAFLNSVRIGGLIIYPYIGLFLLVWLMVNRDFQITSRNNRKSVHRFVIQMIIVVLVGYFGGLIFWPYGLTDPFTHPLESLSLMEHYSISIRQLFAGEWYWSTALPLSYLFVWLMISLPEVILVALLLYILTWIKAREKFSMGEAIVVFSFVFPILYVVFIGSNLYSGWRQMYFIAGPLSVMAALGINRAILIIYKKKLFLGILVVLLVSGSVMPVLHYFRNPDTAYVYFNALAGNNGGAWSDYEYDYYWHGMKRATDWFDKNIPGDSEKKTVASNFDISVYLGDRYDLKTNYVHFDNRSTIDWDYGIFGVNYIHPYQMKNDLWMPDNVLKIISDRNKPLVVIIKRRNDNDYKGIELAKAGNYAEAIPLLQDVIASEPNNFKLWDYLAECYYFSGDTTLCLNTIIKCKELHPWDERINMIEAQIDFDRANYSEALKKCLLIVESNSKYYNIVPLLAACYEKTGDLESAAKLRLKIASKRRE